ncbi:O-methyltransferase [Nocardioides acrostichi]|uniref:Class I SAM-dependent methyltransferase n=1 Tax=Nocardioides acrostichi TaxID=2784339 RepID=A0A930UZ61_9ACTN|nr:class I SAM-dependent methyltransferase [Nocardioides acrostichi]MBF4160264.1 class I SAM-dependent methyltransferase [Nocardioides acrostichi]
MTRARTLAPRPVTPVTLAAALVDDAVRDLDAGTPTAVVRAALVRAQGLLAGHDAYPRTMSGPPSEALARLAERTASHDWAAHDGVVPLEQEMLSGHLEGSLLALLVALGGARRVLEVGLFTGYSALAMAEALPSDGEVVACEIDPGVAALARESLDSSEAGRRVRVEVGPAAETLGMLAGRGEVFDLVFVDADKTGYPGYVAQVLDAGLLRVGGLLCVDNTMLQGEPWSEHPTEAGAAVHAASRLLAEDPRVAPVLVPLRDGLTLARRLA